MILICFHHWKVVSLLNLNCKLIWCWVVNMWCPCLTLCWEYPLSSITPSFQWGKRSYIFNSLVWLPLWFVVYKVIVTLKNVICTFQAQTNCLQCLSSVILDETQPHIAQMYWFYSKQSEHITFTKTDKPHTNRENKEQRHTLNSSLHSEFNQNGLGSHFRQKKQTHLIIFIVLNDACFVV